MTMNAVINLITICTVYIISVDSNYNNNHLIYLKFKAFAIDLVMPFCLCHINVLQDAIPVYKETLCHVNRASQDRLTVQGYLANP